MINTNKIIISAMFCCNLYCLFLEVTAANIRILNQLMVLLHISEKKLLLIYINPLLLLNTVAVIYPISKPTNEPHITSKG